MADGLRVLAWIGGAVVALGTGAVVVADGPLWTLWVFLLPFVFAVFVPYPNVAWTTALFGFLAWAAVEAYADAACRATPACDPIFELPDRFITLFAMIVAPAMAGDLVMRLRALARRRAGGSRG